MRLRTKAAGILKSLRVSQPHLHFLGSGIEGKAFSFEKSGKKYILKVFHDGKKFGHEKLFDALSSNHIKYIKELSKCGLIPKVYKITPEYYIQKYIDGVTLDEFLGGSDRKNINKKVKIHDQETKKKIYKEIENLVKKWHKLGFYNADLHTQNIMVSNKRPYRVYFIDPYVPCSRTGLTKSTVAVRQNEDNLDLSHIKYDLGISKRHTFRTSRSRH